MGLITLKFVTDVRDLDYEVVEFHGELDQSTHDSVEKQLTDLVERLQGHSLIFDLSDLSFINSEGIGLVASLHAKLAKKSRHLVLCGVQSHVADVFEVVGIAKLVPVFKTVTDAIHFIKKQTS